MPRAGLLALSHPVVMLCLAGLLYLIYRESGRRMRSLGQAALAFVCYGVGMTIQLLGLLDPHGLVIVIAGALYLAAAFWLAMAVCQLAGVRDATVSLAVIAGLGLMARLYFTWGDSDNPARIMTLQATITILCCVAAYRSRVLLRRTWVERLFHASVVAFALLGIWRVLAPPAGSLDIYGFNDGPFWTSTLAMINVFAVLFSMGFIGAAFWQRLSVEKRLSRTDALTGMLNRRGFGEAVESRLGQLQSYAIILFDLDRFKKLNDTWGHAMGDAVLEQVGRIVVHDIRPDDEVARIGGEEFVVFLPDTPLGEACEVAQRLRAHVEAFVFGDGQETVRCTASFGVVACPTATPWAAAVRAADRLLYQSKAEGRNRVSALPPDGGAH